MKARCYGKAKLTTTKLFKMLDDFHIRIANWKLEKGVYRTPKKVIKYINKEKEK